MDAAALASLARRLLGPEVAIGVADPGAEAAGLWPAEAAAIAGAVPARQREFAAGRRAARQALAALGLPAAAIAPAPDRSPVWPQGIAGSIAHAGSACLAVAARQEAVAAIGIDIEPDAPLPADLLAEICIRPERDWLAAQPAAARGALARVIFCAKEAVYKCQYPLSRTLFGFDAIEIRADPGAGRFAAVFRQPAPPFAPGARIDGRFARGGGVILAVAALPAGTKNTVSGYRPGIVGSQRE